MTLCDCAVAEKEDVDKRLQCELCNKDFQSSQLLRKHVKYVHYAVSADLLTWML